MTGYGSRGTLWNCNNLWSFQIIRIFSTFHTLIKQLCKYWGNSAFGQLWEFSWYAINSTRWGVFGIGYTNNSLFCTSAMKDNRLGNGFHKCSERCIGRTNPFPHGHSMEEKYSLSVLLILIGHLSVCHHLTSNYLYQKTVFDV